MPENIRLGLFEKWWLLRHSNPKTLNEQLRVLNEQRVSQGEPEIIYLIPHQVTDELRSTMYHYLFIRASEGDIRDLVQSQWNRNMTNSLRLCYDHGGAPLWASQKEMDQLVAMMIEFREVFEVVPSEAQFEKGDQLQVKLDIFQGYDFSVRSFSGADKGANLILEMPLCNGRLTLRTKSVFVSDDYLPKEMRKLLSPDDIKVMERELIAIAARRFKCCKKSSKTVDNRVGDDANLNNFHYLNYMQLDDTPEHRHVRVLLLLCAALRKDCRTVEALTPAVTAQLLVPRSSSLLSHQEEGSCVWAVHPVEPFSTDEQAFTSCILYIATHDVSWREAAKQYQQTHRPLSEPLSLLLPVIKNIHFRTPKVKIDKLLRRNTNERVRKTLAYINACDYSTLTPEAVDAIFDILALPAYDTDEGHRTRDSFRQKTGAFGISGLEVPIGNGSPQSSDDGFGITDNVQSSIFNVQLKSSRQRLRALLRPTAAQLEYHYRLLLRVFPDRSQTDAHDYYVEFITLLRDIYKTEPPLSPSWWRMKALLEHYHSTT